MNIKYIYTKGAFFRKLQIMGPQQKIQRKRFLYSPTLRRNISYRYKLKLAKINWTQ